MKYIHEKRSMPEGLIIRAYESNSCLYDLDNLPEDKEHCFPNLIERQDT